MILAVDVRYRERQATVAGVLFHDWLDAEPFMEVVSRLPTPAAYTPGAFYQRELPCILKLIREHHLHPEYIVVDGYVWLDGHQKPGLGRHLYNALAGKIPVVGVAKSAFRDIGRDYEVYRGRSRKPLYVTTAGIPLEEAKVLVGKMQGDHRIPSLLKRVDRLARMAPDRISDAY